MAHIAPDTITEIKQILNLILTVDRLTGPDSGGVDYHAYGIIHIPIWWG